MKLFCHLAALFTVFLALPAAADDLLRLDIQTGHGTYTFNVEITQTEQQITHGLMDRRSLASDFGMLFLFLPEQQVAFWMKNTLIPLDMMFIAGDGTIRGIARQTKPLSLENIWAPEPVRAVLEVNGGTADRLGIAVGDKVLSSYFKN